MEKVIRVNAKIKEAIDWKQEAEYWKAQAQKNYDDGLRAAGAIAKLMTDAFAERDNAIAEVQDLSIELMAAQERIYILEQRIAMLTAQGGGFVS